MFPAPSPPLAFFAYFSFSALFLFPRKYFTYPPLPFLVSTRSFPPFFLSILWSIPGRPVETFFPHLLFPDLSISTCLCICYLLFPRPLSFSRSDNRLTFFRASFFLFFIRFSHHNELGFFFFHFKRLPSCWTTFLFFM